MGGLREERFDGSGRGVENESEGWGSRDGWWRRQLNGISDEEEGKQQLTTGIVASLTPDFRNKEESNNIL